MSDLKLNLRTYTWSVNDNGNLEDLTGLEQLRLQLRPDASQAPIASTLGFWAVEFEYGRAVFEGQPERFLYNNIGSVHGGYFATLLDTAISCAVHSALPAGVSYSTLDLQVSFVRALTEETGRIRCEGTLLHIGRRVATASGRIADSNGRLYGHGSATCLILPKPGADASEYIHRIRAV